MSLSPFRRLHFLPALACSVSFIFLVILINSCQKPPDVDLNELPVNPVDTTGAIDSIVTPAAVDSTKLIKSILYTRYTNGLADSLRETYKYDSSTRTIKVSWQGYRGYASYNNRTAEFKYNSDGNLIRVDYSFPPGYIPDQDLTKIVIGYDSSSVIQDMSATTSENQNYAVHFNRSDTGQGYMLSWKDLTYGVNKARFDSAGRCIISRFQSDDSLTGPNSFYTYDSIAYDQFGNAKASYEFFPHPSTGLMTGREVFVFTQREARGSALYNQRQLLMRGVANLPDHAASFYANFFGCLSFAYDIGTPFQYCKYPLMSARVFNYYTLNSYRDFTARNEFDGLDRLTLFTGFTNDAQLSTTSYAITYYK
jgi:hypothetical protein